MSNYIYIYVYICICIYIYIYIYIYTYTYLSLVFGGEGAEMGQPLSARPGHPTGLCQVFWTPKDGSCSQRPKGSLADSALLGQGFHGAATIRRPHRRGEVSAGSQENGTHQQIG